MSWRSIETITSQKVDLQLPLLVTEWTSLFGGQAGAAVARRAVNKTEGPRVPALLGEPADRRSATGSMIVDVASSAIIEEPG
jgi:hypothetical protein